MLGAAFHCMGHPLNTSDPKIVKPAEKQIVAQKPLRQDPDGPVGRVGSVRELMVERDDIAGRDIRPGSCPEGRQDVMLQDHPEVLGRVRLAPDRDLGFGAALGEIGDGGWVRAPALAAWGPRPA